MPANNGMRPFQPPAPWFNHPAVHSAPSGSTTYTDSGSGTVTLTGSATEAAVYTETVSGTVTLTGSLSDIYGVVYKDAPTGTANLAGSSSDAVTFHVSPVGTLALTGSATDSYVVAEPTRTSQCDIELEQGGLLELEDATGFLALEACVVAETGSSAQGGRSLEDELYALLRNDDEVAALFAGVMA